MEIIKKVRIFGDSIMKGIVRDGAHSRYKTMADENFKTVEKKFGIKIFNSSKFGCTVEKGLKMIKSFLQKEADCDTVLLEYGGNDCNFNWEEVSAMPEAEHRPVTELPTFVSSMRSMVDMLNSSGIRPVMMTLPPVDAEKYLDHMQANGLSRSNVVKWLGDAQLIHRFQELYSYHAACLAKETGTHLVDVRSKFLDRHDFKSLICDDGIHPSPEGHRLILEAFMEYMERQRVNAA